MKPKPTHELYVRLPPGVNRHHILGIDTPIARGTYDYCEAKRQAGVRAGNPPQRYEIRQIKTDG